MMEYIKLIINGYYFITECIYSHVIAISLIYLATSLSNKNGFFAKALNNSPPVALSNKLEKQTVTILNIIHWEPYIFQLNLLNLDALFLNIQLMNVHCVSNN